MANLVLNGAVHGAALNGKILFDNSANWQDLGDLKTSSKDMSWANAHNSIIAGSHMVAKQNDDGSVSIEGYIDFSYWEVDWQKKCTIWTLPDGFTKNGEVDTSGIKYTEGAFLIRAGASGGQWPDEVDVIYKVGITNGSLWFAPNSVPGRIGIAFFNDLTIPKKTGQ